MGLNRWQTCCCLGEDDRATLVALLTRALPHVGELTPAEFDLLNDLMPTDLGDVLDSATQTEREA